MAQQSSGYGGSAGHRALSPDQLLAQAVTSKLEDGNLRAAIRLMCSDDTAAQPSPENVLKLQEKHPPAHRGRNCLPASAQFTALSVEKLTSRKRLCLFQLDHQVAQTASALST